MLYRILRNLLLLGLGLALGFALPYGLYLDQIVRERFEAVRWTVPDRVFARPLELSPGQPMDAATLLAELEAARYREQPGASLPGSFERQGSRFLLHSRAFVFEDGPQPAQRASVQLAGGQVTRIEVDGRSLASGERLRLDPARIATLYASRQEDRIPVNVAELPVLLITGLQAVEDRQFAHHRGIDVHGIARAAWVNLRQGRLAQGGSTLTQQLVRALYLSRERRWLRKFNEAAMALLLEWRYDKRAILEAYLNEVYLGQSGAQAIHGVGAASQFYFGRAPEHLDAAEIALLIGLIRGPSFYDPRRHPQRALARRDRVLEQFEETGLLTAEQRQAAQARPLGVVAGAPPPRNPHPAFLGLLRQQLASDYRHRDLGAGGLSILSTLAPSLQRRAERGLVEGLEALGQPELQGAVVVVEPASGEVLALVGGRDPRQAGFNRALHASRQIGSLAKPFVYLVALADPARWHLASVLDDRPIVLTMQDGQRWAPENFDRHSRGSVLLVDALSQSLNLATVQLGMELDGQALPALLRSLGLREVPTFKPSHLLGAFELAPLQVAQAYQYLASGGHALPLRALRGVVDASGEPLRRYAVRPGRGSHRSATALVTVALQESTRSGTARRLAHSPLAALSPAGKTGTSNERRDSWFAGWTGSHLGVVWLGYDDNRPTGLTGASGALPVWQRVLEGVPARPLDGPQARGLQVAWVDPSSGRVYAQACGGLRMLWFDAARMPAGLEACADPVHRFGAHRP